MRRPRNAIFSHSGLFRDDRGTITILAAFAMTAMLAAAGIAVDIGSLYLAKRTAQGAADLAAVAAASDMARARPAALATLAANGFDDAAAVNVVVGRYDANPAVPAADRFIAGGLPHNAVAVTLERPQRLFFAKAFLKHPKPFQVTALAATSAAATFSVGTRLLALREGLPNALIGGLVGGSVTLSVMDYEALADADLGLGDLLGTAKSQFNLTAASYDQVLDAQLTAGQIFDAAATLADRNDQTVASAALRALSRSASQTTRLPLRSLIDLGTAGAAAIGTNPPGLDANISLLDLVRSTAALSNGGRQVDIGSAVSVPGLLSLSVSLAIGEPPQKSGWVAAGSPGTRVYTAQTRLRVVAEVGGSGLLAGFRIKVPVAIDVAHAEATLDKVTCREGGGNVAVIAARPGIASLWLGDFASPMDDFTAPPVIGKAQLVTAPLLRVSGSAHITAAETSPADLTFSEDDVTAKTVKRTETSDILQSAVSSLVRDADLKVSILGLGIGLPAVLQSEVARILANVATPLDAIVAELLATLGVHLGEADVQMHGISCRGAVLAG